MPHALRAERYIAKGPCCLPCDSKDGGLSSRSIYYIHKVKQRVDTLVFLAGLSAYYAERVCRRPCEMCLLGKPWSWASLIHGLCRGLKSLNSCR